MSKLLVIIVAALKHFVKRIVCSFILHAEEPSEIILEEVLHQHDWVALEVDVLVLIELI